MKRYDLNGLEFEHGRSAADTLEHDLHRDIQLYPIRRDTDKAGQHPRPLIYFYHRDDFAQVAGESRTRAMLPMLPMRNNVAVNLATATALDPHQIPGGAGRTEGLGVWVEQTARVAAW